jgi:hypothetical protein
LNEWLEGSDKLVEGAPGYEHARELTGIALEAKGREGQRYLFVAATGRQVSNDHYPYYEFLFQEAGQGAAPKLLSHRRLYYDVAGMEGAEWPVVFVILLLFGTLLVALALVIRAAIDTCRGRDALQTVTVVTVLVLSITVTLVFGLGGCSTLRSGPTPGVAPAKTLLPTATPTPVHVQTQTPVPTPEPTRTRTRTPKLGPTYTLTPVPLKRIPFLPTMGAHQLLRAQVAYLDFEGGSGVRFLTQYVQERREINNRELFYTFQGITDDGHAYVSAFLPVSHPSLPVHLGVFRDARDTYSWRYAEYATWIEEQLNEAHASSFTPGLDQLDALIRSLEVGPRCPSVVPPVTEEQEGPYHGWGKAVKAEYGFVLRYPPSWALKEVPGQILFCQDRFRLRIAYRRQDEAFQSHWTGIPAGDVQERGRISVPGGEVIRRELVFEDKLKVLLYSATVGDLEFSARLDDVVSLEYRDVELTEDLTDQADQILSSLEGL